mgnify:CR=1 FL=1
MSSVCEQKSTEKMQYKKYKKYKIDKFYYENRAYKEVHKLLCALFVYASNEPRPQLV